MSMTGKTVIVTGAGKPDGIGRACADRFLQLGANVVICDLPDSDGISAAIEDYAGEQDRVSCIGADVGTPADAKTAVAEAIQKFGGIDILVNNAGVGVGSHDFMELTAKDWELSLTVNLMGQVNFCEAVIPEFLRRGSGVIVNISSLSGVGAISSIPACYTASKFAAVGLTKQLALQYAPNNIRVNAVCPGSVRTDMMRGAMELIAEQENISIDEAEALEASTIPMGRAATPVEIATSVSFLAGSDAGYLTGVALPVAGGMPPGV
jgi:3-oxoacyl-[acyl-carrier protein] reductase